MEDNSLYGSYPVIRDEVLGAARAGFGSYATFNVK